MTVLANWTVDDVLRNVPEAAPVLARLGIDTCCGGTLTLADAAGAADLTIEETLAALRPAVENA